MLNEIIRLKKEKNAIILAHFYQPEEIQNLADYVGDSLELSKTAKNSTAEMIVFCGVDFMAESAKLLSPHKTVLLPAETATCPMANMVTAADVLKLREKHPDAAVVTYINSSTEVKAVSDICCTSANAIKIINSLPNDKIIFIPDKNLGSYVSRFTDKEIILFNGYCPVHNRVDARYVNEAKEQHPNALLAVHPECLSEVVDRANFCGSTSQIINYVNKSDKKEFIIGTEDGVIHTLKKQNPDKVFYPLADNFKCKNMKKIAVEDVLRSLREEIFAVELDEDIIKKASVSLKKMMDKS